MNSMNTRVLVVLMIGFLGVTSIVHAQELKITSGFLKDSIKIGEPTGYYLTAKYPSNLTVLFPDSTFDFSPFEYDSKKYFPTVTNNSESFDSAVYFLTTFEIDSILYLTLPVFQVNQQDCTVVKSPMASIQLKQLVRDVPDSVSAEQLPLKTNTDYQPVFLQFNYPIAILIAVILVVIILVVVLVFGKRIRRYFQVQRLQKNHKLFLAQYTQYLNSIGNTYETQAVETLLFSWKKYLEKLESIPFTKLTTKETVRIIKDDSVGNNLSAVDRAIYGNHIVKMEILEGLLEYANVRFNTKLDSITHG